MWALVQTSYDDPLGPNIADSVAWENLSSHVPEIEQTHLRELLKDEARTHMLTAESDGVYADFSRQRVTGDSLKACAQKWLEQAIFG
jgi:glucose-6-phosphate isomerase